MKAFCRARASRTVSHVSSPPRKPGASFLRLHGFAVAGPLFRPVGRAGKPAALGLSDKAVAGRSI